jgi:hypothetical protein
MDDTDWTTLVESIKAGTCTPFLGAGVAVPHLPAGGPLARELAQQCGYPLPDADNLARVTQFMATTHQPDFARRKVKARIVDGQQQFGQEDPSGVPTNFRRLAELELPIYITTNYDDFMARAVVARTQREARLEISRWHDRLLEPLGKYRPDEPTVADPLVFHLHGHVSNDSSMLVTEDDYVDFMVSLANRGPKQVPVLPHWVRRALGMTTLLFVGYSLEDWNFRVLMRHLMKQQKLLRTDQAFSVSIQLAPEEGLMEPERREAAMKFLSAYLERTAIRVHWGNAADFLAELHRRVAEASPEPQPSDALAG